MHEMQGEVMYQDQNTPIYSYTESISLIYICFLKQIVETRDNFVKMYFDTTGIACIPSPLTCPPFPHRSPVPPLPCNAS